MNNDRDIPLIVATTDSNPRPRDSACDEFVPSAAFSDNTVCRCGWSLGGHTEDDKRKWNPNYGETTEEALARMKKDLRI